ncbi:hypothetical protein L2750_13540 [Shewanella submarina]|uniref:Uncharacterized protein n=1 Tax=Shewanella submarina TaxID=2016376 RepID=A0ABV7GH14_9GAMM|nr:hypothetical protein [Shewanella submarina]MCL1038170.1 hypothetical protein [Shewanella submarina]
MILILNIVAIAFTLWLFNQPEIHFVVKGLVVFLWMKFATYTMLSKYTFDLKPCPKCNYIPDKVGYWIGGFVKFQGKCPKCGYEKERKNDGSEWFE